MLLVEYDGGCMVIELVTFLLVVWLVVYWLFIMFEQWYFVIWGVDGCVWFGFGVLVFVGWV